MNQQKYRDLVELCTMLNGAPEDFEVAVSNIINLNLSYAEIVIFSKSISEVINRSKFVSLMDEAGFPKENFKIPLFSLFRKMSREPEEVIEFYYYVMQKNLDFLSKTMPVILKDKEHEYFKWHVNPMQLKTTIDENDS